MIAEHNRDYDSEQWNLEPIHYLKLISMKPGSFERAKPINIIKESWSEIYNKLLRTLSEKYGDSEGKKQFIEILLLQKKYSHSELEAAIEMVFEIGGVSYEVINHIINWTYQKDKKTEPLLFDSNSYLSKIEIPKASTSHFAMLMGG